MMHLHETPESEDPDTRALVEAVYDGIVETPGWASFLDRACLAFDAQAAFILIETNSLGHPERMRFFSTGADADLRDRVDAFSSRSIFAGGQGAGGQGAGGQGAGGQGAAVAGRAAAPDSGAPAEVLSVSVTIAPGIPFAFGLWGRAADTPFTAAEHDLCRMLAPHLTRAMRVFVRYAQAYRERLVYQAVIERIGVGVALVDAKVTVMATNAIAREMLGAANGLKIVENRLTANTAPVARALEAHVLAAAEAQTAPSHDPGQPLAVPRADGLPPLTVMIHPGPEVGPVNTPLRRSAIVVMRDPDRRASVSADVVGRLFGLTPAEANLAALLAQGSDLDEAAAELGIRRNTARSQLQAVFMKTEVKRQSELVRMILSSVATLAG